MSLIWTESFAGFERHEGGNDDNVTLRLMEALQVAGYKVTRASTSSFLSVVPDPVVPSRAALRFNGTANSNSLNCVIAYELPVTLKPIIFGFSLFIPSDFVPSSTQPSLVVGMHPTGASNWASLHNTPAREAFRVRSDLSINIGNAAPQSVFKPVPGRQAYFEVRIDGQQVSVWMDDILVHQSDTGGTQVGMISIGFTSAIPIPNNWCIGNLYILAVDDVEPNVRLGPTTRVIGKRPAADVRADFVRPEGFDSNAQVVAQEISAAPEYAVQTTEVGSTDIYAMEDDADTAGAAMVHAVVVKSVAANLEAAPHSYTPFIRSNGIEASENGSLALLPISPFSEATFHVIAEHPTKGIVIAGTNNSMWYSDDDGDTWTKISESEGAGNIVAGVFSSNGNGLFIRANSQLLYCHDSSPIDEWGVMASGATDISVIDSNGDVFAATSYGTAPSGATRRRKITYPKDGPITTADIPAGSGTVGPGLKWGHGDTWVCLAGGATSRPAWRSTDNLATITQLGTITGFSGTSYGTDLAYGDGVWLHLTQGQVRRSYNDGASWTLLGTLPFTQSASSLRYFPSIGRFVVVGTNGTFGMTVDGSSWELFRLNTSAALRGCLVTKTGRLIVVGDGGLVAVSKREPVAKDLVPLAGYKLYHNIAAVDPATGLPWTPGAAAIAEIGMRVES